MSSSSKRRVLLRTIGPLIGLVAGLGLGFWAHASPHPVFDALLSVAEPVGTLWVNALRMLVVPFMLVLLVVAVASVERTKTFGTLGASALAIHLGLMVLGAGFALLVFQLFVPGITPATELAEGLLPSTAAPVPEAGAGPPLGHWIEGLVPSNLVRAASENAIIPLIIVAILFGLALRRITPERKALVLDLFRGLHEAFLVLLHWILAVMTIGVFAVSLSIGAQTGIEVLKSFGTFLAGISLILLLFTLALYLPLVFLGGDRLKVVARALWPVQVLAASTRSSLVCLPVLAENAHDHLNVSDEVSGFVLPLTNSTFRLNRALSSPLNYIFLAHFYGLSPEPATIALFVGATLLTNFSTPGLPSAGLFTTAPLYLAAGIPLEGVVMLKAIDAIPDVFKTICNVTGDMTVLSLTDRWARHRGLLSGAAPRRDRRNVLSPEALAP